MKTHRAVSATLFLLLAQIIPHVSADEAAEQIVDRAIRAHGGMTNLARTKQMIRKAIGVINVPGGELQFTDEMTFDLPDRFRLQIDLGGAMKTRLQFVINGNQGWQVAGGVTEEMGKPRLTEMREEMHVFYVTGLAPLRTDRQIAITAQPDEKVQDQTFSVVKVSRAGLADLRLFFDKATGRLARVTRKANVGGVNVDKEYRWSDFKVFDGTTLPAQELIFQQEKKFSEVKAATYSFPRTVEERAFAKP